METDKEKTGSYGGSYTTMFRQYDPRVGRWLSLDPLMAKFPHMSPYAAFDNNPILYTDPYGLEPTNGDPTDKEDKSDKQIEITLDETTVTAKRTFWDKAKNFGRKLFRGITDFFKNNPYVPLSD